MNNKSKAFTLIELMIIVSIIGLLSAIALPTYQTYIKKTKIAACQNEASAYIKNRGISINTNATSIDSYTPLACLSGINTAPTTAEDLANNAIFIAKDTTATEISCTWITLTCTSP